MGVPKVAAANSMQVNLDIAKNAVGNIAPLINNGQPKGNLSVSLTPDGFLSKPLVTETLVAKPEKVTQKTNPAVKIVTASKTIAKTSVGDATVRHYFPYGYCTYYVSQQRLIPWSGNAISWLSGARSFGFATGNTPQVGAIIVTSEGGRTGHVGMVDAVNGDQVTITEMNYHGFGVISSRTISASYPLILGYIY